MIKTDNWILHNSYLYKYPLVTKLTLAEVMAGYL